MTETQIANFGLFRIARREEWTSVCYDINWTLSFKKEAIHPPVHETTENEAKKKRVVLFRQKLLFQLGWKLMKRNISGETGKADINELKAWLTENYPGVEIPVDDLPKKFAYWPLVSGVFLQILVTITVGAITRFHLGNRVHASWILLWIYGSASLRWTSIITRSLNQSPCLFLKKWILFAFGMVLEFFLAIGVLGGITVILVELLGTLCNTIFFPPAGIWILIGFLIAFAFGGAACVVSYSGTILGRPALVVFIKSTSILEENFQNWKEYDARRPDWEMKARGLKVSGNEVLYIGWKRYLICFVVLYVCFP